MEVSIVSTMADLVELEDEWHALVERAPDSSVFQTFPWQSIWWQVFGDGRELRTIIVRDRGKLAGILPLYVEPTKLVPGLTCKKVRLVGYGGDTAPDDLGPIVAHANPNRVVDRLIDGLESFRNEWDIAEFDDLHPDSAFIARIGARRWGEAEVAPGASISYVELPATWDGYLALLSPNRRWKLRRGRTKLHEHCRYQFELVRSPAALDAYYPDLVRLHRDRWEHRAEDFGFSTTKYVEFHRRVMGAMLERNWLRLMVLKAAEGVIAANYCYHWRDGFYFFQGGFAQAYEPYRIGEVLMGHAIEQAISEGKAIFDMLRGEHDYKKSLTNRTRERTHLRVYRPTLRTLFYRALRSGYRGIRRLYGAPPAQHAPAAQGRHWPLPQTAAKVPRTSS